MSDTSTVVTEKSKITPQTILRQEYTMRDVIYPNSICITRGGDIVFAKKVTYKKDGHPNPFLPIATRYGDAYDYTVSHNPKSRGRTRAKKVDHMHIVASLNPVLFGKLTEQWTIHGNMPTPQEVLDVLKASSKTKTTLPNGARLTVNENSLAAMIYHLATCINSGVREAKRRDAGKMAANVRYTKKAKPKQQEMDIPPKEADIPQEEPDIVREPNPKMGGLAALDPHYAMVEVRPYVRTIMNGKIGTLTYSVAPHNERLVHLHIGRVTTEEVLMSSTPIGKKELQRLIAALQGLEKAL